MLDTNVLLSATDTDRGDHLRALRLFSDLPGRGTALYASGQVMREYLSVATRPQAGNGLGLELAEALSNVRSFRSRTTLLAENVNVADRLLALLGETPCAGKQVHDASIVATMLAHGVDRLITINVGDFTRFQDRIALTALGSI